MSASEGEAPRRAWYCAMNARYCACRNVGAFFTGVRLPQPITGTPNGLGVQRQHPADTLDGAAELDARREVVGDLPARPMAKPADGLAGVVSAATGGWASGLWSLETTPGAERPVSIAAAMS